MKSKILIDDFPLKNAVFKLQFVGKNGGIVDSCEAKTFRELEVFIAMNGLPEGGVAWFIEKNCSSHLTIDEPPILRSIVKFGGDEIALTNGGWIRFAENSS